MSRHHPDLVMCRKQAGIAIGRLCDKCDGKCPVCDSYVRPTTLVRICDECSFGNYQNKCVVCGGEGISDAFYCFECTRLEKDRDGCPKIINLGSSRTDVSIPPEEIHALVDLHDDTNVPARAVVLPEENKSHVLALVRLGSGPLSAFGFGVQGYGAVLHGSQLYTGGYVMLLGDSRLPGARNLEAFWIAYSKERMFGSSAVFTDNEAGGIKHLGVHGGGIRGEWDINWQLEHDTTELNSRLHRRSHNPITQKPAQSVLGLRLHPAPHHM